MFFSLCASASPLAAEQVEPGRIVQLLDYVAHDYARVVAVRDAYGREWDEQLEILDGLKPAFATLAERLPGGEQALTSLRRDVRELGSAELVAARAEELVERVVATFSLDRLPRHTPNRERGRALYFEHCASCHGRFGDADTDRARSLDLPPAPFVTRGETLSPQRAWQTIRYGVPGTAMIGFQFLDDDERWDVAAFVAALRHRERAATAWPRYAPVELARMSDAELADDLYAAGAALRALPAMIAGLRTGGAFVEPCRGDPVGCARDRLARTRQVLSWGERELGARLLREAHLHGVRPAQARFAGASLPLAAEIDERLMLLRSRIEHDALSSLRRDIDTLLDRISLAELARLGAKPPTVVTALQEASGLVLAPALGLCALLCSLGGAIRMRRRSVAAGALAALALCAGYFCQPRRLPARFCVILDTCLLSAALALLVLPRLCARIPRFTSRADIAWCAALAVVLRFVVAIAARAEARFVSSFTQQVAGTAIAIVAVALLVLEGATLLERVPERIRTAVLAVLTAFGAWVMAGEVGWLVLTIAHATPRAYAWIGTPALGVYPAREPIAFQLLCCAASLAPLLRRGQQGARARQHDLATRA